MQVAAVACSYSIALLPLHNLRHLVIKNKSKVALPIATLLDAPLVETLSMTIVGGYADWSGTGLDLSSLKALKHVHLENFAPERVITPMGCMRLGIASQQTAADS